LFSGGLASKKNHNSMTVSMLLEFVRLELQCREDTELLKESIDRVNRKSCRTRLIPAGIIDLSMDTQVCRSIPAAAQQPLGNFLSE